MGKSGIFPIIGHFATDKNTRFLFPNEIMKVQREKAKDFDKAYRRLVGGKNG